VLHSTSALLVHRCVRRRTLAMEIPSCGMGGKLAAYINSLLRTRNRQGLFSGFVLFSGVFETVKIGGLASCLRETPGRKERRFAWRGLL
jgi:hypothetical protein